MHAPSHATWGVIEQGQPSLMRAQPALGPGLDVKPRLV